MVITSLILILIMIILIILIILLIITRHTLLDVYVLERQQLLNAALKTDKAETA